MTLRPRALLAFVLAALGTALAPSLARAQAPVILSVSYNSTFPSQYIGTTLSVQVTAIQPLTGTAEPLPVSVTAYTAGASGSVTLGGLFAGTLSSGAYIYVSDGLRVWRVTYAGGNAITLDAADLLPTAEGESTGDIPASWPVADYSSLANTTFSVYTGTLVTEATPQAQMSVDIGQFAQVVLYDNGGNGDAVAGDGIWTARYQTPNLGSVVTDAYFYGECLVGGVSASNEGLQSGQNVSFDMQLPAILTESETTTNSDYNGDLYLSSQVEGQSVTNAAAVEPVLAASCAQAQFNFSVNKANTTVLVTIGGSPALTTNVTSDNHPAYPMVPVTLPAYAFPNGAQTLHGWAIWNGADGNGNYVPDGIYQVYYYVYDTDGLSGVTVTTQVKVVSLKMGISDITLTPSNIGTQPAITNGLITNINYNVTLSNDSSSYAQMNSSLGVLGWGDAGQSSATYFMSDGQTLTGTAITGINSPGDAESTVWTMQTQGYLTPSGTFVAFTPGQDTNDWDAVVADALFPFFDLYTHVDPNQAMASDLAANNCASPYPDGTYVIAGDQNPQNDWWPKGLVPMQVMNGTNASQNGSVGWTPSLQPVTISEPVSVNWMGNTPPQGSYRINLQSQLTGLAYVVTVSQGPNVPDPCSPAAGAVYVGDDCHFWPQNQIDTLNKNSVWGGPVQGDQLSVQNATAIFNVNATQNPTSDNTPPQFVASNPTANSILQPGVYSSSNPLSVEFQDTGVNFETSSGYSYITVVGPQGNVAGQSSTNLGGANGTLTLYFQPDSPLTVGGSYTMNAYTCNVDGLCVQQTVPFTVVDTTAPSIVANNGVMLGTEIGAQTYNVPLCQTTPAGPYEFVDQVQVTIAIPGTSKNTLYLPGCSVSLYQVSGTTQVAPVAMAQLTSQNVTSTQATLVYQISPPLQSNAVYQVVTQTESQDPSGGLHIGPAPQAPGTGCVNDPEFATEICVGCLALPYANNPSSATLAVTSALPSLTVTTQTGAVVATGSVSVLKVATNNLPLAPGYTLLPTASASYDLTPSASDTAAEFYVNGSLEATPLTWTYANAANLQLSLWYNPGDLTGAPGGTVSPANLQVLGYNGSWHQVTDAQVPASPTASSAIQVAIPLPNGSPAYTYYALAYPAGNGSGSVGSPTVVATPVSFPDTRAFDPASPTAPRARFYYASVAPQDMNVEIYDTAGRRVRSLSLGDGITASDYTTDPLYASNVMYYFEWDGKNDAGGVVRNGLYLVRWTYHGVDGSHSSQVKPVALIQ